MILLNIINYLERSVYTSYKNLQVCSLWMQIMLCLLIFIVEITLGVRLIVIRSNNKYANALLNMSSLLITLPKQGYVPYYSIMWLSLNRWFTWNKHVTTSFCLMQHRLEELWATQLKANNSKNCYISKYYKVKERIFSR